MRHTADRAADSSSTTSTSGPIPAAEPASTSSSMRPPCGQGAAVGPPHEEGARSVLSASPSGTGLSEVAEARGAAREPGRALPTATELEMPVVQRPVEQQLAGPPTAPEPGRGDAIEQFPDRPPLVGRHAGIETGELLPKPGLTSSC